MKILEKVLNHYDNQGQLSVKVPEWADDEWDGIIYFKPLTVLERNKIMPELAKDSLDFVVSVVVMKAEDADGEKLFGIDDKPQLKRRADYSILDRIAAQILKGVDDAVGEE